MMSGLELVRKPSLWVCKLAFSPTGWILLTMHIKISAAVGLPGCLVWLSTGASPGEARLLPNAVAQISNDGLV